MVIPPFNLFSDIDSDILRRGGSLGFIYARKGGAGSREDVNCVKRNKNRHTKVDNKNRQR